MPGAEAWRPINPPDEGGPRDGALPAYVANGLIGLRVREMPLMAGMALVNGVAGEHPERRVEAAAPVPYPLAGDLSLNGVWLSDQPWSVSNLSQAYDFAAGELTSRFRIRLGGVEADVEVLTFASRTAPALVMQEIRVRPDAACRLRLRARVATTALRGRVARRAALITSPDRAAHRADRDRRPTAVQAAAQTAGGSLCGRRCGRKSR